MREPLKTTFKLPFGYGAFQHRDEPPEPSPRIGMVTVWQLPADHVSNKRPATPNHALQRTAPAVTAAAPAAEPGSSRASLRGR